jgi:hypothetical protein
MNEMESFSIFCKEALASPEGITAQCQNSSEARALRKRFYRLRAQLPEEEREAALTLQASVVGRHFKVEKARALIDWTQLPTGASA